MIIEDFKNRKLRLWNCLFMEITARLKNKTDSVVFALLEGELTAEVCPPLFFSLHFTRTISSFIFSSSRWATDLHAAKREAADVARKIGKRDQEAVRLAVSFKKSTNAHVSRCEWMRAGVFTVSVTWFLDRAALWSAVIPSLALKSRWAPPFFRTLMTSTTLSRWAANVSGLSGERRQNIF